MAVLKSANINVMLLAVQKAARGLKRDYGELEQLQVTQKGPADFVTNADIRTEKILIDELSNARPGYGFVTEETGVIVGSDSAHRWVIDPIDGTTNFMHGVPHFAISIALEREGEAVAGVVYDPVKEETFIAEKGGGAFLNGRRLRVSGRTKLHEVLLATGIPFRGHGDHGEFKSQLTRAMEETSGVRRFGAASLDLAYVAAGRYDGYWESGVSHWDIAAGLLLVQESGGMVSDVKGGKNPVASGTVLASGPQLHQVLLRMLG